MDHCDHYFNLCCMNQIILVKTSGIHMRNNPINGIKKTLLTRSDWCEGHFENNGCQIHETTPTQQFFDYWQKKKNCRHNFSNYVGMQSSCKISAFLPICETLETCLAEQLCYYSRNLFIIADFIWVAVDLQRWRWVGFESKEIGSIFSWRKYL